MYNVYEYVYLFMQLMYWNRKKNPHKQDNGFNELAGAMWTKKDLFFFIFENATLGSIECLRRFINFGKQYCYFGIHWDFIAIQYIFENKRLLYYGREFR